MSCYQLNLHDSCIIDIKLHFEENPMYIATTYTDMCMIVWIPTKEFFNYDLTMSCQYFTMLSRNVNRGKILSKIVILSHKFNFSWYSCSSRWKRTRTKSICFEKIKQYCAWILGWNIWGSGENVSEICVLHHTSHVLFYTIMHLYCYIFWNICYHLGHFIDQWVSSHIC